MSQDTDDNEDFEEEDEEDSNNDLIETMEQNLAEAEMDAVIAKKLLLRASSEFIHLENKLLKKKKIISYPIAKKHELKRKLSEAERINRLLSEMASYRKKRVKAAEKALDEEREKYAYIYANE